MTTKATLATIKGLLTDNIVKDNSGRDFRLMQVSYGTYLLPDVRVLNTDVIKGMEGQFIEVKGELEQFIDGDRLIKGYGVNPIEIGTLNKEEEYAKFKDLSLYKYLGYIMDISLDINIASTYLPKWAQSALYMVVRGNTVNGPVVCIAPNDGFVNLGGIKKKGMQSFKVVLGCSDKFKTDRERYTELQFTILP